jgi:hypothetical protein
VCLLRANHKVRTTRASSAPSDGAHLSESLLICLCYPLFPRIQALSGWRRAGGAAGKVKLLEASMGAVLADMRSFRASPRMGAKLGVHFGGD